VPPRGSSLLTEAPPFSRASWRLPVLLAFFAALRFAGFFAVLAAFLVVFVFFPVFFLAPFLAAMRVLL
jgi:hypothetical protein